MKTKIDKVATIWAVAGGIILFAITFVTVTNVGAFALDRIARLFGGTVTALPGYEDFVRLAISMAALMFFPYCQSRSGHVAVDLFVAYLPKSMQRLIDSVVLLLMGGLALFLAYWMAQGMLETRSDEAVSRVLGWPQWPFYIPGIVSLFLWAAVAAMQFRTVPQTGQVPEGNAR